MSKYNEGDEVVVTGNSVDHQFKIGEKIRVTQPGAASFRGEYLDRHDWWRVADEDVASSDLSWDTLSVGDLIFDDDGDPHRVFGVAGEIVFIGSSASVEGGTYRWDDTTTLRSKGWIVQQDSPADDTTELSVAEIETKLGVPAGTLRVKED